MGTLNNCSIEKYTVKGEYLRYFKCFDSRLFVNCLRSCNACRIQAILLFLTPALSFASEIDYFRLTGLGGSLELGYSVEDLEIERVDGSTSSHRPTLEQKLKIETEGYVYHPNLLEVSLDVGADFKQEETESNTTKSKSKQTRYSFNGELDFLSRKPYPFTLYFNQTNPTSKVGLGDTITQENRNYGLIFSLREPLVTFPVFFNANRSETSGEGGSSVIDTTSDYQSLRVLTRGLDNVSGQLTIDHSKKYSGSGSLNLPLQNTINEKYGLDISASVEFGEEKQNDFFNKLTYDIDEFKDQSSTKSAMYYSSLNIVHSDTLHSRYRYDISNSTDDETGTESTSENLTAGMTKELSESWHFTGDVETSDEESLGFDKRSMGTRSSLQYRTDFSEESSFRTSYTVNYVRNKQVSDVGVIDITGEPVLFSGLLPVALDNDYVAGPVVVSNVDRTQTYVEGFDYFLTVVGGETRLQRLLSGNIADGETVLVDYSYETGGTFEYDSIDQSITAGLTLYRNYRFRVGYSKEKDKLTDGRPIRPLYGQETAYATANARHRLTRKVGLTWYLKVERQTGELRPSFLKEADVSLSTPFPLIRAFGSFNAKYLNIDNELSDEDVNLTSYGMSLFARTGLRSTASFRFNVEKDSGGAVMQENRRAELNYNWRYRLVTFVLKGEYDLEKQGEVSREDSSIHLTLIRKF